MAGYIAYNYGNGSDGGIINFITIKPATGVKFSGTTNAGTIDNLIHLSNTLGFRLSQTFSGTINRFPYIVNSTYNYTGVQRDADGNVNAQPDRLGENSLLTLMVSKIRL